MVVALHISRNKDIDNLVDAEFEHPLQQPHDSDLEGGGGIFSLVVLLFLALPKVETFYFLKNYVGHFFPFFLS